MITYLKGVLTFTLFDSAVVEVNGIGYQVYMSSKDLSRLPVVGETVRLLTKMQLRDDVPILYGFLSQEEKRLFERLVSVSGVGSKVALAVLSTYEPDEVVAAISSQDTMAIQHVPGIGKKMASRIILELKESLEGDMSSLVTNKTIRVVDAKKGAVEALLSMGFTSTEAEVALKGAPDEASETVLLQYALKRLGE